MAVGVRVAGPGVVDRSRPAEQGRQLVPEARVAVREHGGRAGAQERGRVVVDAPMAVVQLGSAIPGSAAPEA